MKKIIKYCLKRISRIIYHLIPDEFKNPNKSNKMILEIYYKDQINKCYQKFNKYFLTSVVFRDKQEIRKYAIENALSNKKEQNYFYLEFGVWQGTTANFFSSYAPKLYAFDSFEGLKEDWHGKQMPKGHFNLDKKIPKLNENIIPVVGWVQDTLEDFLKKHNPKINFIHLDIDTYEASKYVLEKIKPHLVKNAILIFDELFNFPGWEVGEYKALTEVFMENEYEFKAFNLNGSQVVIQIN